MKRSELLKVIGQNVFYYRKEMSLTQEQLAECVGVTVGTISKIERGSLAVMTTTLYRIAETLRVTCDALL